MPKPPVKADDFIKNLSPAKPDVASIPESLPIRTVDLGNGKVRRVFKNLRQVSDWAKKTGRTVREVKANHNFDIVEPTAEERALSVAKKQLVMKRLAAAKQRDLEKEAADKIRGGNANRKGGKRG